MIAIKCSANIDNYDVARGNDAVGVFVVWIRTVRPLSDDDEIDGLVLFEDEPFDIASDVTLSAAVAE